MIVGSVSEGK